MSANAPPLKKSRSSAVNVRNSATNAGAKAAPGAVTRASIASVAARSSGPALRCSLFCAAARARTSAPSANRATGTSVLCQRRWQSQAPLLRAPACTSAEREPAHCVIGLRCVCRVESEDTTSCQPPMRQGPGRGGGRLDGVLDLLLQLVRDVAAMGDVAYARERRGRCELLCEGGQPAATPGLSALPLNASKVTLILPYLTAQYLHAPRQALPAGALRAAGSERAARRPASAAGASTAEPPRRRQARRRRTDTHSQRPQLRCRQSGRHRYAARRGSQPSAGLVRRACAFSRRDRQLWGAGKPATRGLQPGWRAAVGRAAARRARRG